MADKMHQSRTVPLTRPPAKTSPRPGNPVTIDDEVGVAAVFDEEEQEGEEDKGFNVELHMISWAWSPKV
jgi:hypothetical protein